MIPYLLGEGNDVVALAQTGTGKTAAFGLPLIQKTDVKQRVPQALILCPTRELCLQIAGDLNDYSKYIDGLKVSLKQMADAEGVKDAQAARRRILRFNDELLRNLDHSKEYFDDILEDVKIYDDYCEEHRDFTNGKTVMATKNIKHCYEQCMEKHSFLS